MKKILMALLVLGSFNAMALSDTEEGLPLKACGYRSVPFLGKYYLAGEYGDKVLAMDFLKDVDNSTMTKSLKESGMADNLVKAISESLPSTLKKGDALKFVLKADATAVVLNGTPRNVSKDAYAGVVRAVKAKIGSDWKQPCVK